MNLCEIVRRNVHHRHIVARTGESLLPVTVFWTEARGTRSCQGFFQLLSAQAIFFWRKQLPTWCSNFSTDKTHLCSGRNFCRQIAQPTLLVNMGRKACRRKTGKPTMVSAPEVGEGAVSFRHTDSKNTVVCSWSKECSRFESFLEPVATCGV